MKNFKQIASTVVLTLGLVFFLAKHSQAQVDTTAKKDTIPTTDTTVAPPPPPAAATTPAEPAKKRSNFIIYAGPNFSTLSGDELNNESETGFHIGMSWQTKGFFHGQFGIRYNNAVYDLLPSGRSDSGDHKFSISSLDFPLTGGINILPGQGLLNLRAFISAVPSFNIGMGDNDYYEKDNVETFVFYGAIGLGIDVFFGVLEVGYNYGFTDMLKDKDSEPGQVFVNIGIRF